MERENLYVSGMEGGSLSSPGEQNQSMNNLKGGAQLMLINNTAAAILS